MCDKHRQGKGAAPNCCCRGGRLERFMEPCLLLLLMESPAHGYELLQRLHSFGFEPESQDPGLVYRHLRRLEKEGMAVSLWVTEGAGPAKRLYEVTAEGKELLRAWAENIQGNLKILEHFLERYTSLSPLD